MPSERDLVVGTAGHIDHGKTALVRALTGIETDRLPDERARGISIDLGFAFLDLGPHRLALVDVPGHERFIRNMLAGATGLDLALLVVAADDSVMPQTREHLEILRLLGLTDGVIALTKADLADPTWLDLVEEEIRGLVAGTFLERAPIVRTSATSGLGIEALRAALLDRADAFVARPEPGQFRMAIDRWFTLAGHGTVVTGTVASGSVALGDELQWWPEVRTVRVRGLHRHDRAVERVSRGMRAAINLAGVHHAEVRRGQEVATPGYLQASRVLSVEVVLSEQAPRPLRHRGRYRLHLGTAEVTATLTLLQPTALEPGQSGLGQLFLAEPVVAVSGQPFVIREASPPTTLGGGRVLEPVARRLRRRDLPALDRLSRLRSDQPEAVVSAALAGYGFQPWTEHGLVRDSGLPAETLATALARLESAGALVTIPSGPRRSIRVLAEVATALDDRLARALGRLHAERPRQSAIRRSHLAAELPDLADQGLIPGLIERLRAAGTILADARTVALRSHVPKLSQGERKLKVELAAALHAAGFQPPDATELAALAGGRAAVLPELMNLLVDEGHAVEFAPGWFLDVEAEAEIRRRVSERLASGPGITMAEFRDLLGTTRKYAVPLGEYLDRIALTRREGDLRVRAEPIPVPGEAPVP